MTGRNTLVRVSINSLILDGFNVRHQDRIAAAMQSELTHLLSDGGIPPALLQTGGAGTLRPPQVTLDHNTPPELTGRLVAQALYQCWSQPQASKQRPGER